jgi:hypothetical protein
MSDIDQTYYVRVLPQVENGFDRFRKLCQKLPTLGTHRDSSALRRDLSIGAEDYPIISVEYCTFRSSAASYLDFLSEWSLLHADSQPDVWEHRLRPWNCVPEGISGVGGAILDDQSVGGQGMIWR